MNRPPTEEETLAQIGITLLLTQDAEDAMSYGLRVIFKDGVITADDFFRLDKRTLGTLIHDLRKGLQIDPSFDELLSVFLDQRNLFVHNLRHQEWFTLENEDGLLKTWQFLCAYYDNIEQICMTFQAYALKFGETVGVNDSIWHEKMRKTGFLNEIQTIYYPKLPHLISSKAT